MSEYDEIFNIKAHEDVMQIVSSFTATKENVHELYELTIHNALYEDPDYYFSGDYNNQFIKEFNDTTKDFDNFVRIYVKLLIISNYINYMFNYALENNIKLIYTFKNDICMGDDANIDGFENLPDDVKNVFYIITKGLNVICNSYNYYTPVLMISRDYNNHSVCPYLKVFYQHFIEMNQERINSINENNKVIEESITEEIIVEDVKKPENKKNKKTIKPENKKNNSTSIDNDMVVNDIVKNIATQMNSYWIDDDFEWKTIHSYELFGISDETKSLIIKKLIKKFDIKLIFDCDTQDRYIINIRIKSIL